MRCRSRAILDAFKWTGDQTEGPEWICDLIRSGAVEFDNAGTTQAHMHISQPGCNPLVAHPGEYIIRNQYGHIFYRNEEDFMRQFEEVV